MLHELIHVVNFDDSGAFIEPPSEQHTAGGGHDRGDGRRDSDQNSLDSSLGSSNGSGSASSSSSPGLARPAAPPSFESFLAIPRDFLAAHALHSATETTLLLEIAGLAIEMDAIVECAVEQIHDGQQVARQLSTADAQESAGGASLATTLVVLLRQAAMVNSKTLLALLQRLQSCIDELFHLRFSLAQFIESNTIHAHELVVHNPSLAQSRRLLAQAEEGLLERLESLVKSDADFTMKPFVVPRWKSRSTSAAVTQVCWPGSSSFIASANSPYRGLDDVRLSSSASIPSSSTSISSSTTTSVPSTTPLRDRLASLNDDVIHSQSSSKSPTVSPKQPNGSNSNDSASSGSGRHESQPRL